MLQKRVSFIFVILIIAACCLILVAGCADDSEEDDFKVDPPDDDDDDTGDVTPPPYDPKEPGPYAVGNTTRVFTDTSRQMLLYGDRQLLTEIWYPVLPEEAQGQYDTPRDMLGKWADLVAWVFGLISPDEVENFSRPLGSIRDVPIAPGGPFPVVMYSHGNGGARFQYYSWCEHLASHGYIVVAPDHPGNAFVSALPDKLIIFNPIAMPFDFINRQEDMLFLMDAITLVNADDPEGFFTGKFDIAHAAITGHSFGGNTAIEVFRRDRRYSACIPFAGPDLPIWDKDTMRGLLKFVALEDHTIKDYIPLHELNYQLAPPPKAIIEMENTGHYTYTNSCDLFPSLFGYGDGCGTAESIWDGSTIEFIDFDLAMDMVNTYTIAWLGWRLKGEDFSAVLSQNLFPDYMSYLYKFE